VHYGEQVLYLRMHIIRNKIFPARAWAYRNPETRCAQAHTLPRYSQLRTKPCRRFRAFPFTCSHYSLEKARYIVINDFIIAPLKQYFRRSKRASWDLIAKVFYARHCRPSNMKNDYVILLRRKIKIYTSWERFLSRRPGCSCKIIFLTLCNFSFFFLMYTLIYSSLRFIVFAFVKQFVGAKRDRSVFLWSWKRGNNVERFAYSLVEYVISVTKSMIQNNQKILTRRYFSYLQRTLIVVNDAC